MLDNPIVYVGGKEPANTNRRRSRLEWIDVRIACHEYHIARMLKMAADCKDSQQRRKLALEIGYARIEVDCHLMPLKEKLTNGGLSDA